MNALSLSLLLVTADSLLWSNVRTMPDDLINTGDGWSATRAADIDSLRIAADDFELTRPARITEITYYSVPIGEPIILGHDWYVYRYDGGLPGALVAHAADLPPNSIDMGWLNPLFGSNVHRNGMPVRGVTLPAGRYFLAFRTVQSFAGGAGKNGALSTRWAKGQARAQWNFQVAADGTVLDAWTPLETFNRVRDQEWAFEIRGVSVSPLNR